MDENELFDLDIERVDLVTHPANRKRIALRKSQADEPSQESIGGATMAEELKTPAVEQPAAEVVSKAEFDAVNAQSAIMKDQIVALQKQVRMNEIGPVCKALSLDAEKVYKAEQTAPEATQYFIEKLTEANTRIEALMKEVGSSKDAEPVVSGLEEAAQKIAKSENVPLDKAYLLAASRNPELAREYMGGGRS